MCSGEVCSSFSTSGPRRVTLFTNPVNMAGLDCVVFTGLKIYYKTYAMNTCTIIYHPWKSTFYLMLMKANNWISRVYYPTVVEQPGFLSRMTIFIN